MFDICPDTYLASMLLFQKIIVAIEILTRNQKVGIYSIGYRISSPGEHCANNSGKKLITFYFYSEAKVLQQVCHSILLPGEH